MFTYLGASAETSPHEISPDLFNNCVLVHIEGYLLFNEKLMMAALEAARESGALISLDLASFTVVEAARKLLQEICSKYVDILIANEDEARVFTGFSDPRKALEEMAKSSDIAVLKLGKKGSLIAHGESTIAVSAMGDGSAIDTTGAGDLWAAGFLYRTRGFPLQKCGELGSACGCSLSGCREPVYRKKAGKDQACFRIFLLSAME